VAKVLGEVLGEVLTVAYGHPLTAAQEVGKLLLARQVVEAAAPAIEAAERERCAEAAEQLKFTLYRPGNGPGAGTQALDVVPLTELLALLRDQPPATEGTTDAT